MDAKPYKVLRDLLLGLDRAEHTGIMLDTLMRLVAFAAERCDAARNRTRGLKIGSVSGG